MEEKQLNFDAPLLSLRRYIPITTSEGRAEEKVSKVVPNIGPFPPPYKSDIKSGPVTKAGSVPFVWEQTPGKAKDRGEYHTQNSKLATQVPIFPPGWKLDSQKQKQQLHSAKSVGEKDHQYPMRKIETCNLEDELLSESSKSGDIYKENLHSDDDDGDAEFSDARDTFSRTESSYVNCSLSGLSSLDNSQLKSKRSLSTESEMRDFMISRFLPAAKAVASEATPFATKQPSQPRDTTRILNMVTSKIIPVANLNSPLSLQQQVPIHGDDSEEDEDYDMNDYVSAKACGLLPRFCLKSSSCLLNPVPFVKAAGQSPRMKNKLSAFKKDTTALDSVRVFDDGQQHSWDSVRKYKLTRGIQADDYNDSFSKKNTESNKLASFREYQAFGLACDSKQLNGDFSPYSQNEVPQSLVLNGSHPAKLLEQSSKTPSDEGKKARSSLRELLKSDSGSEKGSCSSSSVVKKTLYVDSVQELDRPMSNTSLRELMSPKFGDVDIPLENEVLNWDTDIKIQPNIKEMGDICQSPESRVIHELPSSKNMFSSRTSCNVDKKSASSLGDMINCPPAVKNADIHSAEFIREDKEAKNRKQLAKLLKVEDDKETLVSSIGSVLPPPLPKSPSESWLCRTLPATSSRNQPSSPHTNIHFSLRKQVPKLSLGEMPRRKDERMKTPATMVDLYNSVPIDPNGLSNFISRSEAESKKRLERMNQRLKDLEKQMGELEDVVMRKANFSSSFGYCAD